MIKVKPEDIGRKVRYKNEFGKITSFNDTFVFVQYGTDKHSKATNPKDLFWEQS